MGVVASNRLSVASTVTRGLIQWWVNRVSAMWMNGVNAMVGE